MGQRENHKNQNRAKLQFLQILMQAKMKRKNKNINPKMRITRQSATNRMLDRKKRSMTAQTLKNQRIKETNNQMKNNHQEIKNLKSLQNKTTKSKTKS